MNPVSRRRVLAAAPSLGAVWAAACAVPGQGPAPGGGSATAVTGKLLWEGRDAPSYADLGAQAVALFKQRFPQIDVEYAQKPSDWVQKDLASLAAGSGPDVWTSWDQLSWQFAAKGATRNLNELIRRDFKRADLDDFIKGQWDGLQIPNTNHRFALPTYANLCVVFFNRDRFRRAGVPEPAAGWTYDAYAERAKRLTGVQNGQPVFGGGNFALLTWVRTQNQVWAFGGHVVDPKDVTKSAMHLPPAQQAYQWLYDRYWRENSFIQPKQRPVTGGADPALVGNGTIAMAENGMHLLADFARLEGVEWDLAPLPRGPAARLSWIETDGWLVWRESKAGDAAWELAKFLAGPDFVKLQARHELLMPSRLSLLDDWMQAVRQHYPVLEKVNLQSVRDSATASPPVVQVFELFPCMDEANQVLSDILNQIFRDGTASPTLFRDRKDEIERAATACGVTFT
jgi:multiple sugar transport system substrate-binding protein